jgi:hypothetical protein
MNDSPLSHREATEAKVGKRRYVVKLNAEGIDLQGEEPGKAAAQGENTLAGR